VKSVREVLQFSENMAVDNKSIEDVSSAPFSRQKDDEEPNLISDGSTDHSGLQGMGAWLTQFSEYLRDFW
jgi:hypothetical protein